MNPRSIPSPVILPNLLPAWPPGISNRREPVLSAAFHRICRFCAASLLALAFSVAASHSSQAQTPPRLVFAHYMVALPDYNNGVEGYKQDIRDAQAAGLDGFALNCGAWSADSNYQTRSAAMFEAAKELGTNFKLFFSADMTGLGPSDIISMIETYAGHPNYYLYQNRPFLSTFGGEGGQANSTNPAMATWWQTNVLTPLRNAGYNVYFIPFFYAYGDLGAVVQSDYNLWWNQVVDGLFDFGAGGVPDGIAWGSDIYGGTAHGGNKTYMAPVSPQYWGRLQGARGYFEYQGGKGAAMQWADIINVSHPEWVELTTWNDFYEATYFSPIYDAWSYWPYFTPAVPAYLKPHGGLLALNSYYIRWYKTGVQPTPTTDQIYWAYRINPWQMVASNDPWGPVTWFNPPSGTTNYNYDQLYVTTILTQPATLNVTSGGVTTSYNVGAGLQDTAIPFQPGAQQFSIVRGGQTVIHAIGDPIETSNALYNFDYTTGSATAQPASPGLNAQYYNNINFTGTEIARIDPTVNFNWGNGSPDPAIAPNTWSARWTGFIMPAYSETYTFSTNSDDGVRLWVNGQNIVDNWTDHPPTVNTGTIALLANQLYPIRMEYYQNGGGTVAQLSWSSPSQASQIVPQSRLLASGTGIAASYFNGMTLSGVPFQRLDPAVNFNWAGASPAPSIPPVQFSARWSGSVVPDTTDSYTFTTNSDDGVRLWVNGQKIIDNWTDHPPTLNSGAISLTGGVPASVQMDFSQNGGGATAQLEWASSTLATETVPTVSLRPYPALAGVDVGGPAIAGSSTRDIADGVFTVNGSGADVWYTADAFQFDCQPLTGNGQIVARVLSVQGTDPWAKAGVMIRERLAAGSAQAFTCVAPGSGVLYQRRPATNSASLSTWGGSVSAPYWVCVTRNGNTLTSYASADNATWTLIGSDTIPMAAQVYIGLAVTAHNNGLLNTSTFDNVTVTNLP